MAHPDILIAAGLIITSVALVINKKKKRRKKLEIPWQFQHDSTLDRLASNILINL